MVKAAGAAEVGAFLAKPPKARELGQAIVIAKARFGDLLSLRRTNDALQRRTKELEEALAKIKTLRGLIPICASCKKIRSDKGFWQQLEDYLTEHSEADFTHGICPECLEQMEVQLNAIVNKKKSGALPVEENSSDCTEGMTDGKGNKRQR